MYSHPHQVVAGRRMTAISCPGPPQNPEEREIKVVCFLVILSCFLLVSIIALADLVGSAVIAASTLRWHTVDVFISATDSSFSTVISGLNLDLDLIFIKKSTVSM